MPIYYYQALDQSGKTYKGSHDASSESDVRQYLKSEGLYPTEIKISRFSRRNIGLSSDGKKSRFDLKSWLPRGRRLSKDVTAFTRQLETLLEATIPYDKALEMIIAQTPNQHFQSVLSDIRGRVMEGEALADAMSKHPHFSPMYVSMVRSGENSGSLDMIMKRLADYYERQERLVSTLKSAMIYPIFMALFGLLVVVFMMTYIVPKITQLFEAQDAILPLPTQILIVASKLFTEYGGWLFFISIAFFLGFLRFMKTPRGIRFKDRIFLKLPGIKNLTIKVMVMRFCETLATLMKSGIDLKSALEISKHVVVNHVFIQHLDQLIIDVNNKGVPLSAAMKRIEYFPEYVHHVVAIGEQAAKVDELLERVSQRMQTEVSDVVDGLTSLLQPIMIMAMGAVVGFISLAILLPMLNMSQLLQ